MYFVEFSNISWAELLFPLVQITQLQTADSFTIQTVGKPRLSRSCDSFMLCHCQLGHHRITQIDIMCRCRPNRLLVKKASDERLWKRITQMRCDRLWELVQIHACMKMHAHPEYSEYATIVNYLSQSIIQELVNK